MKNCRSKLAHAGIAAAVVLFQATLLWAQSANATPESRAVQFLSVEVPKWSREHKCFSCHNNGDAARALMAALKSGDLKLRQPLDDTLRFLSAPERWDDNGPDGPFKDKKLARVQFAAALAEANRAGVLTDHKALEKAADLLAELQTDDGSWETDSPDTLGSPATYGRALTTCMASRTLATVGGAKHQAAVQRAQRWFENLAVESVLDAAATLLGLSGDTSSAARVQRERCLQLICRGQSPEGGWGPFVTAPAEVFDTALVLLALAAQREPADMAPMIQRGRAYLIGTQESAGSWPATTRPSGADSYAQQLSTTGWATQALLATRDGKQ
jgi:squalene-hopene cyclase-like protein